MAEAYKGSKVSLPTYQVRVRTEKYGWQVVFVSTEQTFAERQFRRWIGFAAHDEAEVPLIAVSLAERDDAAPEAYAIKMSWRKADD